ncbi:hypothetical protein D1AOALGA4SA_6890 [Olavius algarvensis Delta 1 endosymbiont]|nr:hypothetical protein D1AOALGA4SA_6890 [Olavius algarvensis Delta 1 endosymbiont]
MHQVRENWLCQLSKVLMVSGVRFQVSVENETPGPDRTIHESGK